MQPAPGGALLRVRVTPGSSRTGVDGVYGTAVRVRVGARPVEGAANRELLRVLGAALGVRPAALAIEAGARGRDKRVRVHGLGPAEVRARLRLCVDTDGGHN